MLDQNTDRMWYVIGAVLIGAAIILIANGALPQMFASVTESFDDVSTKALTGASSIGEEAEPYNIIDDVDITEGKWVRQDNGILSNASNGYDHAVTDYMKVRQGREYEFEMSESTLTNMRLAYYDQNKNYINGGHIHGRYLLTTAPSNARYVRASARFRAGDYGDDYTPHEDWYFGWVKE